MSYATYVGDARSSWERLDWVKPRVETTNVGLSEAEAARKTRTIPFKFDDEIIFEDEVPEEPSEADSFTIVVELQEIHEAFVKEDNTLIWTRVGYIILAGLLVALVGIICRFVISSPVPLAVAGIGMAAVSIALWYGGRLEQLA
jgi:hypothetical protein